MIGAGYDPGGYGNVVHVADGHGVTCVRPEPRATEPRRGRSAVRRCGAGGERVGTVGSTGFSDGPHLHFELRLRGAMLDPPTGG